MLLSLFLLLFPPLLLFEMFDFDRKLYRPCSIYIYIYCLVLSSLVLSCLTLPYLQSSIFKFFIDSNFTWRYWISYIFIFDFFQYWILIYSYDGIYFIIFLSLFFRCLSCYQFLVYYCCQYHFSVFNVLSYYTTLLIINIIWYNLLFL